VRFGPVSVNCYSEGDTFGGWKQSGFGGKVKALKHSTSAESLKAIWSSLT
jgi:acyl-CoA reductase-like NAD-dependent aldehyde dehydrogenase